MAGFSCRNAGKMGQDGNIAHLLLKVCKALMATEGAVQHFMGTKKPCQEKSGQGFFQLLHLG
jgi:hypothetical protein